MSRTRVIVFAPLLAVNAVVATVALTRTIHLGQSSHTSSSAIVAKRTAQLDRFEASLNAQLAKKPPPLPKVPPGSASAGRRSPRQARSPRRFGMSGPPRSSSTSTAPAASTRAKGPSPVTTEEAPMTSHAGRLYAPAGSLFAFFVLWAAIAAHPWAVRRRPPTRASSLSPSANGASAPTQPWSRR